MQLQRAVALQRLPGGRQLSKQSLADGLQLRIVHGRALTQVPVGLAYQVQDFRIGCEGLGEQLALLQQMPLGALHRQCLELSLVLVLQVEDRIASPIVVQCQAGEQQGQQQAADTEEPAWAGGAGRKDLRHGTEVRR